MRHSKLFWFLFLTYLAVFFFTTFRLYSRLGAFGCGDECINYTAGHFLLRGKTLYSQIFFNRQPLMAYVSAGIQFAAHPQTIYQLVLSHRLFMGIYALGFGIFLAWRFGISGLLFLLLFEGTKFYVYGYQFLGEALIVYPIAYFIGLVWESFAKRKLMGLDVVLVCLFGWLLVFTREPYVPITLVLLGFLAWLNKKDKRIRQSAAIFFLLCIGTVLMFPIKEYIEQVVYINIPAAEAAEGGFFRLPSVVYGFLYPVFIFTEGKWTYFRFIEIGLSIFLLLGAGFWVQKPKKAVPALLLLLLLAIAGVRAVVPGTMFFEAFHMLPWYGAACMVTALFVTSTMRYRFGILLVGTFILFSLVAFAHPKAFLWEQVDKQSEFDSQYAKYTHYSSAIKILSRPTQTLFLDMWDDIIYWESGRNSSFRYSLYIPVETQSARYRQERLEMFGETPPDFYYSCPTLQIPQNTLPPDAAHLYTQLKSGSEPGCLYVKNSIIGSISADKWDEVKKLNITLP